MENKYVFTQEANTKVNGLYLFSKRVFDILASSIGIIIISPLLLAVAIAIKIDSRGPVLFVQDRVGRYGKKFKMYKFRSMIVNAEQLQEKLKDKNEMSGPMFKIKNDPRVTKVGRFIRKTSIDELPQLVNVLKGEMSLVGPRPSLQKEVNEFQPWMMERLTVKPGITCYWQVMGRSSVGFEEWMKLDIKYVRERTFLIDLKLIFKTMFVIFGDENAS